MSGVWPEVITNLPRPQCATHVVTCCRAVPAPAAARATHNNKPPFPPHAAELRCGALAAVRRPIPHARAHIQPTYGVRARDDTVITRGPSATESWCASEAPSGGAIRGAQVCAGVLDTVIGVWRGVCLGARSAIGVLDTPHFCAVRQQLRLGLRPPQWPLFELCHAMVHGARSGVDGKSWYLRFGGPRIL